jgi:hypothetical protein
MTTTRTQTEEPDTEVTTQVCRDLDTQSVVIELGIESSGEGTYASLSLDAARELLAHLAVAIARAEL